MPVSKIIYRSRPAYIISKAEGFAAAKIMGSVDIDSVPEYIGLSIRDLFPGWKVRVDSLFFAALSYAALKL